MNWIQAQNKMNDGQFTTNGRDVFRISGGELQYRIEVTGQWIECADQFNTLNQDDYEIYDTRPRKNFSEALRLMLDGKTCEYEGDKYYFESGVLKRKASDWRADNSAISELMVKGDWHEVKT